MPSYKRKPQENDISGNDFLEPRRSSLRVNLSYMSNVTGSSHGSIRNDESVTEILGKNIPPASGSGPKTVLPRRELILSKKTKRNLPKIISIQYNFNNKEQALSESCSQLKDAILRKTRQIFDQENELAIKTSRILEDSARIISSEQDQSSESVILEKDSRSVILENEITSRSVILEKNSTSRSTMRENTSDSQSIMLEEKIEAIPLETQMSKPEICKTNSLESMILEMSTNTRSTLMQRMKESKLLSQISEDQKSTTDSSSTPLKNNQSTRSPSVRLVLRDDQQIIMSGKNRNSDPVRINIMNSPVSKRVEDPDEFSTPKRSRVSNLLSEKRFFLKKRLFSDENNPGDGSPENDFQDQKNLQQRTFLEPSKPVSSSASPILSGSTKKQSRLSLKRTQALNNENRQRNKHFSSKETPKKKDRSTSPGFPLTCSSYRDSKKEVIIPDVGHFTKIGENDSSCMEITTIPNVLPILVRGLSYDKENLRKELKESFMGSQHKRVSSMEFTEVGGDIVNKNLPSGDNPKFEEVGSDAIEDKSNRTRTSLNVNTSVDTIEVNKSGGIEGVSPKKVTIEENSVLVGANPVEKNGYRRDASGIKSMPDSISGKSEQLGSISATDKSNSGRRRSHNVNSRSRELRAHIISSGGVPSIHVRGTGRYKSNASRSQKTPGTDRSSSVSNNSSPSRPRYISAIKYRSATVETFQIEESLSESLENMSLIKRLKDFFIKPLTDKKKISSTSRSSRSMNITNGNGESSCIEGTPLPISKSFLWKSQIKQNTFTSHLNFGKTFNASEKENETVESVGTNQKRLRKSKELLRHPALCNSGTEEAEPFNESSDKISITESSKSSKPEDSSPDDLKKPTKRKLYPLRGHSQLLSLSPARSVTPTPKRIVFPKRRRNRKWMKKQQNTQRSLRTRNSQKIQKTQIHLNLSSAESLEDEQIDFPTQSSTKRKKPRKVLRKKIIIKKIASSSAADEIVENRALIDKDNSESGRSSLNDFELKKNAEKNKKNLKKIIVTTGLSIEDKNLVKSVIKALGKAEIQINVTHKTTHIVSTGVRTINLLKGIIRGCWLVNLEWVLKSLENGSWLNPEPYEMAHFSAAVQENRRDRQLFGNAYVPELFSKCGSIYVENGTYPKSSLLKELIKTAGGQITEDPIVAKIVVGLEGLKEIWVLDSITTGQLQPVDQYRRN